MAWATSSAGATASANRAASASARRTRHIPAAAPAATPPQMPSPPVQTAKIPYQTCGMSAGVVRSK